MCPCSRSGPLTAFGSALKLCDELGGSEQNGALARTEYGESMHALFRRARFQCILGQLGASITTVGFGWSNAGHDRLLAYFLVHQVLIVFFAFAFASKWSNERRGPSGIPRFAMVALFLTATASGSVMWFDLESAANHEFALSSMIVMYACAAGTMVTLGPVRKLARLGLFSMMLPGVAASLYLGHLVLGFGTLFFLGVVAILGVEQMHRAYLELIELRLASRLAAEHTARRAMEDPLTGLANRRGVERLFARSRHAYGAAMFIDLDKFKDVNDSSGHLAGDQVLRIVGSRIRAAVSPSSAVARMGGDEFLVLLSLREADAMMEIADRIVDVIQQPFHLQAGTHEVSASVGVTRFSGEEALEDLVHRSDQAMLEAKRAGRARAQQSGDLPRYPPVPSSSESLQL